MLSDLHTYTCGPWSRDTEQNHEVISAWIRFELLFSLLLCTSQISKGFGKIYCRRNVDNLSVQDHARRSVVLCGSAGEFTALAGSELIVITVSRGEASNANESSWVRTHRLQLKSTSTLWQSPTTNASSTPPGTPVATCLGKPTQRPFSLQGRGMGTSGYDVRWCVDRTSESWNDFLPFLTT